MKKIIYLLVLCGLMACKNGKEHVAATEEAMAFEPGLVMKFKASINHQDTFELLLAAVKDTLFHSKALKILGSCKYQNESPLHLSGIYYPDSGYRFSLMNEKYEDLATVHMTHKEGNIYSLEYTDVKNKTIKTQAIELTHECPAKIYIQNYLAQDCHRSDSMKKHLDAVVSPWDTTCSIVNVFWPKVKMANGSLANYQPLVYDSSSLSSYLKKDADLYLDVYECNFPIELSSQYLCMVQDGYVFTGGAHGTPGTAYTTINLRTNQVVKLSDIIDTTRNTELYKIAEPFFVKANGPLQDWQFEKGFYTPKNVGILSDGLLFQYEAYEIGSYAQGMPTFFVPYTSLAKIRK